MSVLPNDVKSVVYRYIHRELLNDVNKEYHTRIGVNWSDSRQCFFSREMVPMANWRQLTDKVIFRVYYKIYNMYSASIVYVADLPKNY